MIKSTEKTSGEYILLNSCGIEDLSFVDIGSCRENGRVDYHILYIERGVCHLELDGKSLNVGAGGVIFFRPHERQCYRFYAEERSVSHYIHFTGVGCPDILSKLGIAEMKVFDMGISGRYEEISARMSREYSLKPLHWEAFTAGCLYQLLSLIARKYALRHDSISREDESRINRACRKIYDNLRCPPTIAELSSDIGLSVSRFSHLFKEIIGKAPAEFIISLKIDRATEMLENSEFSVSEISDILGFADPNYFSRLFKIHAGTSPREFRKKCKNTEERE